MKKIIIFCLLFSGLGVSAQQYTPDWSSLETRPVPKWYTDGKFGIFIHWGVYSVPGYTTKGHYAEWYQNALNRGDSATVAYHKAKFGNLTYYQLADLFKAELFNPDEWAKLFEKSGAKYIVLTSKHHDGFTLWPSKDANRTWGFPWNAGDVGPKRDLLGELFKAVRKTSVHAGMYYSLYEWFNPLWKKDPRRYATEHMWPQMKELINTYQPDVLWTDGDWDAPDSVWHSKEFLTWLYNESPVKDRIVTYDRWGKGLRFKHGAVYTPEYQPDLDFEHHAWEESRGMGYSYGYNREEDAWDYNSTQSLVYHLLDKVSRGGNFLLDIGPDEHGKIPPIMEERLLQIGDWLKINGAAIYGTQRWKRVSQWSNGKMDYKAKKGEDIMMKLTVDPEPGYAVKEVFYTYNAAKNNLYAVFPLYPSDKVLTLTHMPVSGYEGTIRFLSTGEKLKYDIVGDKLVIRLPEYDPNKIKAPYAYAVEIGNFGAFVPKPQMDIAYQPDLSAATITLTDADPAAKIRYSISLKGQTATQEYAGPFIVKGNVQIRAMAIKSAHDIPSDTATASIIVLEMIKAVKTGNLQNGLAYQYYESEGLNMKALGFLQPFKTGVTDQISVSLKQRPDRFGLFFSGYIKIPQTSRYEFALASDDGSILTIDGTEVVNNDGNHGQEEKTGRCLLEKGYHVLKLRYFDSGGDNGLSMQCRRMGESWGSVPGSILFH